VTTGGTGAEIPADVEPARSTSVGSPRSVAPWPLTTADVAAALGIADDPANLWLAEVTAATIDVVERERRDLFDQSDPPVFVASADVHAGATLHATNLYRRRDTYGGGGQLDDLGTLAALPLVDPMVDRLLGVGRWRPISARAG
jgi:hypothetical protein